jgi:hypothetical protein
MKNEKKKIRVDIIILSADQTFWDVIHCFFRHPQRTYRDRKKTVVAMSSS